MGQISFDDLLNGQNNIENEVLSNPLYNSIFELLKTGHTSAIDICETLMASGIVSKERYSTNKPKVYYKICSILDEMVNQGKVVFLENQNKKDRVYQLK